MKNSFLRGYYVIRSFISLPPSENQDNFKAEMLV